MAVLDRKGKIYYTNRKTRSLLSKAANNFLEFENFFELKSIYQANTKELYPLEKMPIIQALKGERVVADDLEIIHKERVIPLESMGTPITDELGNIIYAIATFQDISERRKIEAEREKYTQDLFELNQELEASLDNEFQLNDACGRFVPHQFLSFLGYESIVEVKLGDAVKKEMSILFSDIRNFTSLSETMTPDDNFKFINGYLKRMEPAIEKNNGFIDKYIGDAIMALFGGTADDAVKAGIKMLQLLNEYNTTRQRPERPPISIGIGINTGSLILGIVGGSNRISGTVISDAVNLASRIESLTGYFGGTSSATPVVAGVAALMLSVNPDLTSGEVREIIEKTTDKIVDPEPDPQLGTMMGNYDANGYSQWFGFGKVNAYEAVLAARQRRSPLQEPSQRIRGESNGSLPIPDFDPKGVTGVISISGAGLVKDIEVGVEIEHTYLGDVDLYLIAPNGEKVLLQGRTLGRDTVLKATYSLRTTSLLRRFLNLPASGDWRLLVIDHARFDKGTLMRWELVLGV